MSAAQAWLAYAAVFFVGAAYFAAAAVEKILERISTLQLVYVVVALGAACLAASSAVDMASLLGWLSIPALLFAWFSVAGDPEPDLALRAQARRRLDGPLKTLRQTPDDPIALEAAADVYREIGEAELAVKYYRRLPQSSDGRVLEKVARARSSAGGPASAMLRACPGCGSIVFRLQYDCDVCERPVFPSAFVWWAVRFNRFFDKYNLTPIAASGLLFLPFLYRCGPLAYGALWAVWALALLSRRIA